MENNIHNNNQIELRKVQTIHGNSTFVLVLPKGLHFGSNIEKGDYVQVQNL